MFNYILIGLIALSSSGAMADHTYQAADRGKNNEFEPYGQGLPMPWPFPWAKECPVQWSSISGRYLLADSDSQQQVELRISIVTQKGLRFMRISRFDRVGVMISDGISPVTIDQRSVEVRLRPLNGKAFPVYASLKLYYDNSDYSCDMSRLVPILALTEKNPQHVTEVQYRLVRWPFYR